MDEEVKVKLSPRQKKFVNDRLHWSEKEIMLMQLDSLQAIQRNTSGTKSNTTTIVFIVIAGILLTVLFSLMM